MTPLTVTDVFHFADGRTILTVRAAGAPRLIPAGPYLLRRAGYDVQRVVVENEMMTSRAAPGADRSVSLAGRVDLPSGKPSVPMTLEAV